MHSRRAGYPRAFRIGALVAAPGKRRALAWLLCLASSIGLGCGGNRMVAVEPGEARPLADGEAYLIVHIDTDVGLERVWLKGGPIVDDVTKGDHIWIVRTRAGKMAWQRIDFGPEFMRRRHRANYFDLEWLDSELEDEYRFEIEAGSINYPGTLIVRTEMIPGVKFPRHGFIARNRNQSARAVRLLLESHPELIRSLPLRYAGESGDGFLEHYTSERDRLDANEASRPE